MNRKSFLLGCLFLAIFALIAFCCVNFFSAGFSKPFANFVKSEDYSTAKTCFFLSFDKKACAREASHLTKINDLDLLQSLYQYGFSPNYQLLSQWTDNAPFLKLYLENGGDLATPVPDPSNHELLPLFYQCNSEVLTALESIKDVNWNEKSPNGSTALFYCKDPQAFKWFLDKGVDDAVRNDNGLNVYEYFLAENPEMAKAIFKTAPLDKINDKEGHLLLYTKTVVNNPDILRCYIDQNIDLNGTDVNGNTLLHLCENPETMKVLLDKKLDTEAKNNDGATPFLLQKNAECAKILKDSGVNIKAVDNNGNTALHYAKSHEMREFLLQNGLDFLAENNDGQTSLEYQLNGAAEATKDFNSKLCEGLHKPGHYGVKIYEGAGNRQLEVQDRAEQFFYKTFKDQDIDLSEHPFSDYVRIIDDYVSLGCDVTPVYKKMFAQDKIALILFSESNMDFSKVDEEKRLFLQALVKEMLDDIDEPRRNPFTHFMSEGKNDKANQAADRLLIEIYYYERLVRLIKGHIDINRKFSDGNTLLLFAERHYLPIFAAKVLGLGADPNVQNDEGNTALHFAVQVELSEYTVKKQEIYKDVYADFVNKKQASNIDCVEELLKHGAQVDIANSNGDTPLHLAVQFESLDVVEAIMESTNYSNVKSRKELINLKNKKGQTALDLASTKDIKFRLIAEGAVEFGIDNLETDEPEAAADEPQAAADEPEAAADEPQAAAGEPEAAADEPEAAADEPEAAADEPEATADEPEAAADEPEAVADEPEAAADEPEAAADVPKADEAETN